MKNTSELMYKIGKIINIILIPLSAILFILGITFFALGMVGVAMQAAIDSGAATSSVSQEEFIEGVAVLLGYGVFLLVYGFILLVFSIVSLIVCSKKHALIANGSNETSPRVFLIVFGVLGENVFYILAGIFSLVARSQESNTNSNNTVVVEEPAKDADAEIKENIENYQ